MVHKLSRSVCRRRLERSRVSGVKLLVRGNGREEPVPGTRDSRVLVPGTVELMAAGNCSTWYCARDYVR